MYYFDSAYVAKCYLNEADSAKVWDLVRHPVPLYSSSLCIVEVTSAIHRRQRENSLTAKQARDLSARFRDDVERGVWTLIPLSERVLWEVHEAFQRLARNVFLRSGDAIHLVSARIAGLEEIWSNDRHLIEAARHFRLTARHV